MSLEWVPGVRLGPFVFGEALPTGDLEQPLEDLGWEEDGTGWHSYAVPGQGITLHLEAGKLVALECWQRLDFEGRNLVGLSLEEAEALFGERWAASAAMGDAQGMDVDALGLGLWLEAGRVESASLTRVS